MATVYVVTVESDSIPCSRYMPDVFATLDGAKSNVTELWGVTVKRQSPSLWQAKREAFTVSIDKRTVFKK